MFRRFLFSKKAEREMLSAITKIVLVCIILIPLLVLGYKLINVFIPKTDEATLKNFDQLVATIQNMEQGTSVVSYPLYLDSKYVVVGYPTKESAIRGTCTAYNYIDAPANKKPEACGTGNEGCICLCKKSSLFADLCQAKDDVVKCDGKEELKTDISFVGGKYSDGSGQCDFAYVKGEGSLITVSLMKGLQSSADTNAHAAVILHLCTKECGESSVAVASTQIISSSTASSTS